MMEIEPQEIRSMTWSESYLFRFDEPATIFALQHTMTKSSYNSSTETHRATAVAAAEGLCMNKYIPGMPHVPLQQCNTVYT